jgi:sugar/nucleoside kinase (ribokinase family)
VSGRLICLGAAIVDVTMAVPTLPERGGDVLADSGALLVGGSGFNVSVAATRLGMTVRYGGVHGTGPFGDLVRAAMRREGIDLLLEPDAETDTGWDVAITDAGGERTFLTLVGAEARLTTERLALIEAKDDDIVYISGYGLLNDPSRSAITAWLGGLRSGATVVTDPGPLVADIRDEVLEIVLRRTDWWTCNRAEATATTGDADPATAARSLRSRLSAMAAATSTADTRASGGVVVRLGAEGCLVLESDGEPQAIPAVQVEVIDSNGAGDAHTGAFIASLAEGLSPASAAARANAAAALSVTRRGPATAPTADELLSFPTPETEKTAP